MKLHLIQCLIILFFCICSTMADYKKLRCTWQTQAKCVIWKGKKLCACRPIYLNKTYRDCPPSMKYSCKEVAHGPDCRCYRVS